MQWIRRSFIAGCFVMVPLIISVAALVWAFRLIDGVMAPLYTQLLGARCLDWGWRLRCSSCSWSAHWPPT